MLSFAFTNAFTVIWPIFGTANQLLAALTLVTLAAWLATNRKKNGFVLIPAFFMVITTLFSLGFLLKKYFTNNNWLLLAVDILMIALTLALIVIAVKSRKKILSSKDDKTDKIKPKLPEYQKVSV
jgi:carbon starvation protein